MRGRLLDVLEAAVADLAMRAQAQVTAVFGAIGAAR